MRNVEIDETNQIAVTAAAEMDQACSIVATFIGKIISKKSYPYTSEKYPFDEESILFVNTVLNIAKKEKTIFAWVIVEQMTSGKRGLEAVKTEAFYSLLLSEKEHTLNTVRNFFEACYPSIMEGVKISPGTEVTPEDAQKSCNKALEKRRKI